MQKGVLYSSRITQDTAFDFYSDTQGKGVVHLSVKNIGKSPLLIDDAAQEILQPNELFVIESPVGIVSRMSLRFLAPNSDAEKLCIVRYIVPLNE